MPFEMYCHLLKVTKTSSKLPPLKRFIVPLICRSSYHCRYFVLPCCFFDFYGKYQRRQCQKSQYKEYIDFITEVSEKSGFTTQEDCLRIPSTKRVSSFAFPGFCGSGDSSGSDLDFVFVIVCLESISFKNHGKMYHLA